MIGLIQAVDTYPYALSNTYDLSKCWVGVSF